MSKEVAIESDGCLWFAKRTTDKKCAIENGVSPSGNPSHPVETYCPHWR